MDVKKLIKEHSKMVSKAKVLKAQIKWVKELESQLYRSKIEELSLAKRIVDGTPSAKSKGGRIEYVVATYRDEVNKDLIEQGINLLALEEELRAIQYRISLFNAATSVLSEAESQLLRVHYIEALSFREMSEIDLLPKRASLYSESTLKRMHRDILCKMSGVLDSLCDSEQWFQLPLERASCK